MSEGMPEEVRSASRSSGERPAAGLARDLAELARQLQAQHSMDALLARIVEAAVREIVGAEYAGISVVHRGHVSTQAASDALVERIDRLQYERGDGPCLTSLRDELTVRADDLRSETRWPRFTAAAREAGIRSMLSVQLYVHKGNLGSLNLYAARPGAFDDDAETPAVLLAAHAAIAMQGNRVESNLRIALESRDTIGQAKGILMERYKIDDLEAFDLLVLTSQKTHRKLSDIADELTSTGELRVD